MNQDVGIFKIFTITLKSGMICVLIDPLSSNPKNKSVLNDSKVPFVDFSKVINGKNDDL